MENLKYHEIINLNNKLIKTKDNSSTNIVVLSNIIINQLKEILEYSLNSSGLNCIVEVGNYDNIVQDSSNKNNDVVILFWEICNLIDGFHYEIESFDDKKFEEILLNTKLEIDLVLSNLKNTPLVIFNKFSAKPFASNYIHSSRLDSFTNQLNDYLITKISKNIILFEPDNIIINLGLAKTIDFRNYHTSKALYKIDFFKNYVTLLKPFISSFKGKYKKAVIFDCDNTLWGGILGEDGFDNIKMSKQDKVGSIFHEVQKMAVVLNKRGVLIGLCSKNNEEDVQYVLDNHKDMFISDENISIKKINWKDKASNLKEISEELNIGLDSLVFIDDSSFEVNLIRDIYPQIDVIQVPQKLYNYPNILRTKISKFYSPSLTKEDIKRVKMYKDQVIRNNSKKTFTNIEEYLDSLDIQIEIYENNISHIPRISQLTQKTNQFNLTTKRYSEVEINDFIKSNHLIYSLSVSDKFGDNGITGICVVLIDKLNRKATIDTFLLSCRIIGRNIEKSFMNIIINELKNNKIIDLTASYIKTLKNSQVEKFYSNLGFTLKMKNENITTYELNIEKYITKDTKNIKIINHG